MIIDKIFEFSGILLLSVSLCWVRRINAGVFLGERMSSGRSE